MMARYQRQSELPMQAREHMRLTAPDLRPDLPPDLREGVVDVWSINIARALPELAACEARLDRAELERAGRKSLPRRKRQEFIVTRGILKELLARQVGVPAAALHLPAAKRGKPRLAAEHNERGIAFNVSHSRGEALIAITVGGAVGVDIEKIHPAADWPRLAKRFFSPAEQAALHECPEAERARAFFACWTRKEAVIKAAGGGLPADLHSVTVTVGPGRPARLLRFGADENAPADWALQDLAAKEGYAAALALRRPGGGAMKIRMHRWKF